MSSWSQRRKSVYALIVAVVVIGGIGVPAFYFFYKAPTCNDGIQNGSEKGVDCGGRCERLCQGAFYQPAVGWTRFEQVAPGLYNLAAYIENRNTTGEAKNVPYKFTLYDDRGVIISDTSGMVTLPPHRNTIAFKGAVNLSKRIPAKALFEFTEAPDWYQKPDSLAAIAVGEKKYEEDDQGSSLTVSMKNTSVYKLKNISVYVVLYDAEGNALGFSKTILDEIPPQGSAIAPFTWPINRHGRVISIEVLPVVE